jgi:hypothetical protein
MVAEAGSTIHESSLDEQLARGYGFDYVPPSILDAPNSGAWFSRRLENDRTECEHRNYTFPLIGPP